jgi:transcriptional regulator with XRE-family HTH domain
VSANAGHARFGSALRAWRLRRRISQLALALRADTTQRHISYIEQGRSHPGRAMVLRLAESLELTLRERNALLLAADYAPVFPESRVGDPALAAAYDALRRILVGHQPYPALIIATGGQLVAANRATEVLTEGARSELLEPPVNALRLAVHPRGMGARVENLGEWGRHIIDNVRAHALRSPDQRLDELLNELERLVPPVTPGPEHLGFAVPLRLRTDDGELRLITTLTSFATATDVTLSELQLEAYLPADERTARILQERSRRPSAGATFPADQLVPEENRTP